MNQLTRCDRLIQIRAPEFLTKALDSAADKRLRGAPQSGSRCSSAGSARAIPSRSAAALPVPMTSNVKNNESRPDANAPAFRLDNPHDLQDRRKPSIHLEEELAIVVREPGPAGHLANRSITISWPWAWKISTPILPASTRHALSRATRLRSR
jgi:hypothetical protein